MRRALVLLAACAPSRPVATPAPQPIVAPPEEPAVAGPVAHVVHAPSAANDDLPHRTAALAPLLARAQSCLPRADLLSGDDAITIALDDYAGQLVACAQVSTRRGASVFFDPVSYACWDVDVDHATVARRPDLGRAYFRCQDGSCAPGADRAVVGYEGTEQLAFDADRKEFALTTRAGAAIRTMAVPAELADLEPLRGDLTYVGHTIFALAADRRVFVLDDRGKPIAQLPPAEVHVVDAGHVLVVPFDGDHATLIDLATRKRRDLTLLGPAATAAAVAVRFHGTLYLVDDARHLVVLDPVTFAVRQTTPLPLCR